MHQLGQPRRHFRQVDSTNRVGRELAGAGAPHGTLITADEQTAGRGRQGRTWSAPPASSLLMSLVIRDPGPLLSLAAGVAVAQTAETILHGARPQIKWPNDVLIDGRKLAGILVEGRPQERWAVLGIGLNVAIGDADLPTELQGRAASLGLDQAQTEVVLPLLLQTLEQVLSLPPEGLLERLAERDFLHGREISWEAGSATLTGVAAGIDQSGRLVVELPDGQRTALDAGEVHIGS